MNNRLDAHIDAYGKEFKFAYDNDVILNWYPKRIVSLTNRKSKVLELGIGHGYTCNHFSSYYAKYSVIDGSQAVIQQFSEQYPESKAWIIHSYFENFESNEVFDVIIMGFVLEHVDDPAVVLKHFRKFLAPGGRCYVAVPNAESLHRRIGHEAGLLSDMSTLGEGDLALGHKRLYTVDSLERQLNECGYEVLRKEGIFLKPFTTSQLQSLNLSKEVLDGMCKVGVAYPELCAGMFFEATILK